MQLVGSGLAVEIEGVPNLDKDPIFITNAHVVRDAHDVQVQLPAIGQQSFEAFVPVICDDFDLAVVQLVEPTKFLEALKKARADKELKDLQAFPVLPKRKWSLGEEVASVGFPLGSTSLKLSRGVISGTEEVGDFICYQTTAPISPGSSGGPLFGLDSKGELQVVGATFASAASRGAQNTNYVVPTIAISQVLEEYKEERKKAEAAKAEAANSQAGIIIIQRPNGSSAKLDAGGTEILVGAEKNGRQEPCNSTKQMNETNVKSNGGSFAKNAHTTGGENGGREKRAHDEHASLGKKKIGQTSARSPSVGNAWNESFQRRGCSSSAQSVPHCSSGCSRHRSQSSSV
jgi:hypothetical protein